MSSPQDKDFFRFPWNGFPDCIIHADEKEVRGHKNYDAAKTGDSDAAFEHQVVQTNIVSHTKADGFSRLAKQAAFEGDVDSGRRYLLVDDFIGQGGTLANLRGWIMYCGGHVAGAMVLTGKPYSAKLALEGTQIDELTKIHGQELRQWWQKRFGYDYDCLTSSEARYLIRTPSADRIRNRIIAAVEEGSR